MEIEIKTSYHKNGQLMYEWPRLNGKYHGIQKCWYDNGNIKDIWPCLNGQAQGMCQSWKKNGTINWIRQYKNRNQHGSKIIFKYEK